MILSEVLEGETATGSQALSSAVPPLRGQQNRPTHLGGQSSLKFSEEMFTGGPDAECYDKGPKVGSKRASSSLGAMISVHGSHQSKSSRSSDNPFVECANSLSNLASAKLLIKDCRETDFQKFDVIMAN